jgi:hypothetical protein
MRSLYHAHPSRNAPHTTSLRSRPELLVQQVQVVCNPHTGSPHRSVQPPLEPGKPNTTAIETNRTRLCPKIGRFQLVATTFVVSDGRCGCLEGQCRVLPQEEPRTHYIACVNIVSNAKRTAAVRRGPQPRSPTPYTKTLNRDRTAASAPAGSPGDPCVCTSFSTRATARARVPSLPPSSHAARFCRSATWG